MTESGEAVCTHVPEATGASRDDSGIRLPLTSRPSGRTFVDAMVLASPFAANGNASAILKRLGRVVRECTPEELKLRSTQLLTAHHEARSPRWFCLSSPDLYAAN